MKKRLLTILAFLLALTPAAILYRPETEIDWSHVVNVVRKQSVVDPVFGSISTYSINDDANQNEIGDAAVLTDTTKVFGNLSSNADYVGFRITSVTIPNAATIRHAYLKVYLASATVTSGTNSLNGEDADSAAAFQANTNDISGRTLTTANTTSEIHDLADGYRYFDVTSIVQEIIDRAGWASGNSLVFILNTPSNGTMATVSMNGSANEPGFGVIYGGLTDGVRSPTVSGTGSYTNPDNAFSSNDSYATTVNNATAAQIYGTYGIGSLTGATIDGVLAQVEANVSSTSARSEYTIELSWDGGTTWTTAKRSFQFQTTDRKWSYGGADAWSHTFVPGDLTDANFKVRITNDFAVGTNDANVDHVSVQVFYTAAASTGAVSPKVIIIN